MATGQISQYDLGVVMSGGLLQVSGYDIVAVFNIPSERVDVSQYDLGIISESPPVPVDVSQFDWDVVYAGRVFDPQLRAWWFPLDGHEFYVLRLGNDMTLACDLTTGRWYNYGSGSGNLWRANCGCVWLEGYVWSETYGSNVVAGDDSTGTIYFLDPNGSYDDDASVGLEVPRPFERILQAQVVARGYDSNPCYGVQLLGSVGDVPYDDLVNVTLYTSDDRGKTYDDQGTVAITPGDFAARLEWRSLGVYSAPGRLFKIIDYGALKRIDSLTMPDEEE